MLQWSRSARVARSQLESNLTATESLQISHRYPMVLPKLAAHLFPSHEKRVLAQSWQPQNTMMRLKNGNKPQILQLKLVFLTAKMIFSHKILAYILQKLYLCNRVR